MVSLLVGGLVCQCLPLLVPHDLWAPFAQLGIWRYRIYVATMLSGRSMILLAVIGSEVMSRAGWITACEPSRLTIDSAAFNPAHPLPEPRRVA